MIEGVIYRYKSPSGKYYIGQTIDEKGRRNMFLHNKNGYAGHRINEARKKYGPNNFEYTVLMKVTGDDINEIREYLNILEVGFIRLYDSYNNGYNMSEGGHNMTDETREKIKESKKGQIPWNKGLKGVTKGYWGGRKRSLETKEKIRQTITGRHLPEEHRRHISEGNTGKKMSEETRRKISEMNKGKPSCNKGRHLSEEHRRHISESNTGKKMSDEQKKRLSEVNKGRPAYTKGKHRVYSPDGSYHYE